MSVSLSSGVREADLLGFISGKTAAEIAPVSHAKASSLIDDAVPPPVTSSPAKLKEEISAPESAEDLESSAAVKVQKVFRSYRSRRKLADSAVEIEPDDRWWQAIEFARLNQRTISFFNFAKPETVSSRWSRIVSNASKVGKGLSKVANAQKLAFLHWIEAIDPRHRYGKSLQFYYEEWCKADSGQPFFYWLDIGDGKHLDLKQCPRTKLRSHSVKYLAPKERERYEYVFEEGKIVHKLSGTPLTTTKDSMWIFVMSTCKKLYIGEKKKGMFHHSSFLAGGATLSAGWLEAEDGVLKFISPYSGHYRPSDDSFDVFLSILKENGVSLDAVAVNPAA